MHSIQWHTVKTQTNQHRSTTKWNSVSDNIQHLHRNIPLPPKEIQIITYADDITITASHTKHRQVQQLIQHIFTKYMYGPPLIIFI